MSITLKFKSEVTVEERLDASISPAFQTGGSPTIYSGFNTTPSALSATTSPPVTKCAFFIKTLSAGVGTIDLTAAPHNGLLVDMSGLKVQAFKIKNKVGNSPLTVTFGASNPYLLAGSGWKVILLAGQEITLYGNDATPDVDATHKNIDLAGGTTDQCEVSIVSG